MKLLVAIDGSEAALLALRYVLDHQEFFSNNPELLLVNVHLPIPSQRAKAFIGSQAVEQYYQDEGNDALAPALALVAGKACRATHRMIVGQPAEELVALAQKESCDMIVMGTHSRSALGNLFVGSVAMRVIATSPIPVLSVK